jgi:hypothetical protein
MGSTVVRVKVGELTPPFRTTKTRYAVSQKLDLCKDVLRT